MFEDPEDPQNPDSEPVEKALTPADRAREKSDEFRMHAELAAVFEGHRKFDAEIRPGFDLNLARELQRSFGKLEKAKSPDSPIILPASWPQAAEVLKFADAHELTKNDYHIHRRPGEVMIVRWLAGEQVETFYQRLQAHFDAAIEGCREDEREAHGWKKDPATLAYLAELDKLQVKMADRYLRDFIKQHKLFVLSTQTADEINIAYLCNTIMGIATEELVGDASAPPDEPTEHDLAWFFKLFSLRGMAENEEQMCFFTFLQKSEDTFDAD